MNTNKKEFQIDDEKLLTKEERNEILGGDVEDEVDDSSLAAKIGHTCGKSSATYC
jgi:hypothetical protein